MRVASWIVAGGIVVGVAMQGGADAARSPDASCGHVEELVAAKRALEAGDRQEALRHLKTADALLERCMRDAPPVQPRGERDAADTQAG